jgi:hypothetical protein
MRIAALFIVFLAAPSFAEEPKVSFSLSPGVAWTIPFTSATPAYNGLRQDIAFSLLAQLEAGRWLVQADAGLGGRSASNPSFKLFTARLGVFVFRGNPDVSISLGAGYMTYTADSTSECGPEFRCDKFEGSGLATVAEVGVRFSLPPIGCGVFLQGTLPLFDVTQDIYPGLTRTRAIGVASIGFRLFL